MSKIFPKEQIRSFCERMEGYILLAWHAGEIIDLLAYQYLLAQQYY